MDTKWIFIATLSVATLGVGYFFLTRTKQKRKPEIPEKKEVEILTLHEVTSYFKDSYMAVSAKNNEIVPIALKLGADNPFGIKKEDDAFYVVLTYFNEKEDTVVMENTLLIKAKSMDSNLTDAFADKDMLILK